MMVKKSDYKTMENHAKYWKAMAYALANGKATKAECMTAQLTYSFTVPTDAEIKAIQKRCANKK